MKINKLFLGKLILLLPLQAFADRYGIYDYQDDYDYDSYHGGSYSSFFDNLLGFALMLICSLAAYFFLLISHQEWKERQSKNEKPRDIDDFTDLVFMIIGYGIVSFFLSAPILLTIKWIEDVSVMKDSWLWVHTPAFFILTFLRRT